MGTAPGVAAAALNEVLERDARCFSFFAALDAIEARCGAAVPVGERGPAAAESVRFVGNPSLAFPTAEVDAITARPVGDDAPCYCMSVNLLGLYGPGSPLPLWYTEEILRVDPDDRSLRDFLDLFNHRLVSLLRRCGTKYRYYLQYRDDCADPVSQWLLVLMGVLDPALRGASALDWRRLLAYAGIIAMRRPSAAALRGMLSHYLGVPVEVREFVREWVRTVPEQWTRLGIKNGNCTLGQDAMLGEQVQDCTGRIALRIGPLGFERFERFLPGGADAGLARDLVALLARDPLACDRELVLAAAAIPSWDLSPDNPCRLGWSTWLGGTDKDGCVVFRQ